MKPFMHRPALVEAINIAGSQAKLAKAIGKQQGHDVRIRRVENGFIITVGEGDNGKPAPQYVARDFEQLCEILKEQLSQDQPA
jgi:hypothetical protein